MKKLFIIICVLLLGVSVYADDERAIKRTIIEEPILKAKVEPVCPKTLMKDSCLTCHSTPGFGIKEKFEEAAFLYKNPPSGTSWILNDNKPALYHKITSIESGGVFDFFQYAERHKIKHVIIEIYSPGGPVFSAWRIVGLMKQYESKGMIIETRCYGFAASAGFVIFASGTKGHRFVSPTAELMWHEIQVFKMFDVSSTSAKEDEAEVLRHLQSTLNEHLASVSNVNKEEWDRKIDKLEWWMNGAEALELGIADGYM